MTAICKIDDTISLEQPDGPDADDEARPDRQSGTQADYGRVNPFNPCLPYKRVAHLRAAPVIGAGSAPFDDSTDWFALQ